MDYPDQGAKVIGGVEYKSIDVIDDCPDYFAGVKLSTGYDYISYIRILGVGKSGQLNPGTKYQMEIRFAADCRAWSKSYLLNGEIRTQNSNTIPLVITETSFKYREKFTGSVDSYCYTNICGTATFKSEFTIPSGASGPLLLAINAAYNPASVPLNLLTQVSKNWTYSGFLNAGSATSVPTPTPTPTPTSNSLTITTELSAYESDDGGVICYTPDFTPEAISKYSITGTRWKISVDYGKGFLVMDEYDWGLGIAPGGGPKREFTANGAKVSVLVNGQNINYSYAVKDQKAGYKYECSVSIITKNGIGPAVTKYITASYDTSSFAIVTSKPSPTPGTSNQIPGPKRQKAITCIKGKLTMKIKAKSPKCPKGYKKK